MAKSRILASIRSALHLTESTVDMPINSIKENICSTLQGHGRYGIPTVKKMPNIYGGEDFTLMFDDGTTYIASRYGNLESDKVVLSLHGVTPAREVFHRQFTDKEILNDIQHWVVDVTPHLDDKEPLYKWYTSENYSIVTQTYLAGFVNRLLSHTHSEKILLEWISKGWYDALNYAALFPDHIKKIILISPSGLQENLTGTFDVADLRLLMNLDKDAIRRNAPAAVGVAAEDIDDASRPLIEEWAKVIFWKLKITRNLKDALSKLDPALSYKWIEAIKNASIPTKLVWSANDHITPPHTFAIFKEKFWLSDDDVLFLPEWWHALIIGNKTYTQYNQRRLKEILWQ